MLIPTSHLCGSWLYLITGEMASHTYQRKNPYKSKAKILQEVEPFEITKVQLAQECYVDKENLRAFQTAVFTGSFKTMEGATWTVSIIPDNIEQMYRHADVMKLFSKVGLQHYLSLPAWETDIKRSYQLLNTLDEDGTATIEDKDGVMVQVHITEDMICEALKLPKGNQSLLSRNTSEETNATFLLIGSQEYTFRDLLHKDVECNISRMARLLGTQSHTGGWQHSFQRQQPRRGKYGH